MDRSSSPSFPVAAQLAPEPVTPTPTRGPPAAGAEQAAGQAGDRLAADAVQMTKCLAADRDRIAQGLNEVVVHRLFAVGLDLQAALGLVGDQRGSDRINHAIGELDLAITDLRYAIFGRIDGSGPGRPSR